MFSAEEIENCDIFPNHLTKWTIIKALFYIVILFFGLIFVYSIYAERDFYSLITLDSYNYIYNTPLLELLFNIDSNYKPYKAHDKLIKSSNNITTIDFIENYVSKSLPLIMFNSLVKHNDSSSFDSNEISHVRIKNFENILVSQSSNSTMVFEKREIIKKYGPKMIESHASSKREYLEMTMKEYIDYINMVKYNKEHQKNQDKNLKNNEISHSMSLYDHIIFNRDNGNQAYLNKILLWFSTNIQDVINDALDLQSISFSMSDSLYYSVSETDSYEKIICVVEGGINIMAIPGLQINGLYPYNKEKMLSIQLKHNSTKLYSPVNFYSLEYSKFANFKYTSKFGVQIGEGSCFYIPSLMFFQFHSNNDSGFKIFTMRFEGDGLSEHIIKGIINENIN
jgi:hypothetical protein